MIFISKFSSFLLVCENINFVLFSQLFLYDFIESQSLVKVNALTLSFDFFSIYFSKFLKYLLPYISTILIDNLSFSFLKPLIRLKFDQLFQ